MIDSAMAAGSKAHLHPQSLSQSRHVATQHATANQTEFFARQIMDPGAKIAKMRTLLPGSGAQGALVGRQIAGQGQHQCQGMFDYGMHRIALYIADGDAASTAGLQIHIVGTGCRHRDEPQLRQRGQFSLADPHLVDDGHSGALQSGDHLLG